MVIANTTVLKQGLKLVSELSDACFVEVSEPWSASSIGEHIRHVLDMYEALKNVEAKTVGSENEINFDIRRRGSILERSTAEASAAFEECIHWLAGLDAKQITHQTLKVRSEVDPDKLVAPAVESTFLRELMFVGSHTVHHYALIKMLVRFQGLEVDENFGIAPATLSDMRNKIACAP